MDVYIYAADIYCDACGRELARTLALPSGAVVGDESSYDSDSFPKGPYPNGGGEADAPQHCGSGGRCLKAIAVPGTDRKTDAFLANPLTTDGEEYVRRAVAGGGAVAVEIWAAYYCRLWSHDELAAIAQEHGPSWAKYFA